LVLLGILVLVAGYWYMQFTAEVGSTSLESPNIFDAQEADRKLKLFEGAQRDAKKGFIRLTEIELNSYLREHYLGGFKKGAAPGPESGQRGLLDCRLDLTRNGMVWHCWLHKPLWKHTARLYWERTFGLARAGDQWTFALRSMRVGDVDVPRRFWPQVQGFLGGVDEVFVKQSNWVAQLPAVELRPNEFSQSPELRLYTYPDPSVVQQATR
jgi:hypothetical protein